MAALLAVAVVYVVRLDTASGGALPPLKIVPDSRTLRRRSPDSPLCTLECPAEALLRTFKSNSSGLTHATSSQSRLTPLHPRVPSRGPPPHLQGNSSGLTHATNVAAVPTQPPAPSSASGPGPAFTAAPTMRYGSAFSGNTNPNARRPGTFQVPPALTP